MMEKTAVYIDNGYLKVITENYNGGKYHKKIDINQLANTISKKCGLWCDKVYFYCAPPYQSDTPTPDEIQRKSNHDKFVFKLRKIGIDVREGRCQKKDKGEDGKDKFGQKGVDTLLTMDLVKESMSKKYTTLILLACDTDFVPIIEDLNKNNIKIILFYYSDRKRKSLFSMSNNILSKCYKNMLLTDEIFDNSIKL